VPAAAVDMNKIAASEKGGEEKEEGGMGDKGSSRTEVERRRTLLLSSIPKGFPSLPGSPLDFHGLPPRASFTRRRRKEGRAGWRRRRGRRRRAESVGKVVLRLPHWRGAAARSLSTPPLRRRRRPLCWGKGRGAGIWAEEERVEEDEGKGGRWGWVIGLRTRSHMRKGKEEEYEVCGDVAVYDSGLQKDEEAFHIMAVSDVWNIILEVVQNDKCAHAHGIRWRRARAETPGVDLPPPLSGQRFHTLLQFD